MRAVVTRVDSASVAISGKVKSSIGKGFLILLGVHEDDEEKEALKIADKICGLRIFEDEAGKMNVNPADAGNFIFANSSQGILPLTPPTAIKAASLSNSGRLNHISKYSGKTTDVSLTLKIGYAGDIIATS